MGCRRTRWTRTISPADCTASSIHLSPSSRALSHTLTLLLSSVSNDSTKKQKHDPEKVDARRYGKLWTTSLCFYTRGCTTASYTVWLEKLKSCTAAAPACSTGAELQTTDWPTRKEMLLETDPRPPRFARTDLRSQGCAALSSASRNGDHVWPPCFVSSSRIHPEIASPRLENKGISLLP